MYIVILVSNIGEATFFSPGALGGTSRIMGLVGGYVIDLMIRVKRRERDFALGYYQGGVR